MKELLTNTIQNNRKENESFRREIERYDVIYRKMLSEYSNILEENKRFYE